MSKEIKEKIDKLNMELEEAMDPTTFVLNPTVATILRKIDKLREDCIHSFIGKECEYCGWRKE